MSAPHHNPKHPRLHVVPRPAYPCVERPYGRPVPGAVTVPFHVAVRHVNLEDHDLRAVLSSDPPAHSDATVEAAVYTLSMEGKGASRRAIEAWTFEAEVAGFRTTAVIGRWAPFHVGSVGNTRPFHWRVCAEGRASDTNSAALHFSSAGVTRRNSGRSGCFSVESKTSDDIQPAEGDLQLSPTKCPYPACSCHKRKRVYAGPYVQMRAEQRSECMLKWQTGQSSIPLKFRHL